jgi:hypothetical protein
LPERVPLGWPKLPCRSYGYRAAMSYNSGKAMPPDASIRAAALARPSVNVPCRRCAELAETESAYQAS